jgi:hypothetical protein
VRNVVTLEETGSEKIVGPFVLAAESPAQEAAALSKPASLTPQAVGYLAHRFCVGQQAKRVCVAHVTQWQEWS